MDQKQSSSPPSPTPFIPEPHRAYRQGAFNPYHKPRRRDANRHPASPRRLQPNWWGQQWIRIVEKIPAFDRAHPEHKTAGLKHVGELVIEKGIISALVLGTRQQKYTIRVAVPPIPTATWRAIATDIAQQPALAHALNSGEVPPDVESFFLRRQTSLFPSSAREMDIQCSCSERSNTCPHIAVVLSSAAETLDKDPFLLFALRGTTQKEFIQMLTEKTVAPPGSLSHPKAEHSLALLPRKPSVFWSTPSLPDISPIPERPRIPAAAIKQLGAINIPGADIRIADQMEYLYDVGSMTARDRMEEVSGHPLGSASYPPVHHS